MSEPETETEQDVPFEEPEPVTPEPDEAETAQAEEDEANEEGEPEPEPEHEPVDEERTQMFGKIDRSFNTYKAAVERNLGDEVIDWMFCPLCASGAVVGYVNKHDLGRVPDDVQANVQMFLGFAREQEYPQNPHTRTCPVCEGSTRTKTGAKAGEYITMTCDECGGYGFVPPPEGAVVKKHAAGNGAQVVGEAIADLEQPDRDMWGEPRILPDGTLNSNYMKMPQGKAVHPVYGVTANLSPEELALG